MIQRMLKRKVLQGVQICQGGSVFASGFKPGVQICGGSKSVRGPNPRGSKSAVTPAIIFSFYLGPEDINMKENIPANLYGSGNMPPFFIPSQSVTMATKTLQQAPCQVFNQCVLDSNNNVPSGDSSQSQRQRKRLVIIDLDSDQSIDIVTRDPFKKAAGDVCRPFLRTLQRRSF